jgi:mannose-6-phosphate isomerase-like protein (cupin superfamily)
MESYLSLRDKSMPVTHPLFDHCNLYGLAQTQISAHGGEGFIRFTRILTRQEIAGACNFMDFTIMPPGSTIGSHTHSHAEEEYYLVLAGEGTMVVEGRSFPVKPGDLLRNPPGGAHALTNNGDRDLQLFVFELQVLP